LVGGISYRDVEGLEGVLELVVLDESHGLFLMETGVFWIGLEERFYNFDRLLDITDGYERLDKGDAFEEE
jgi:hypothetical protein